MMDLCKLLTAQIVNPPFSATPSTFPDPAGLGGLCEEVSGSHLRRILARFTDIIS